jgi:hypothetical protein
MDPSAEVLGPVLYGSEAYFTFQNAPDWPRIAVLHRVPLVHRLLPGSR